VQPAVRLERKTYSILMKRDTVFSTIANGANASIAGVSRKPHWTKDILANARVDSEWIDGKRRSGLADVSISEAGGREIQRFWPGGIRRDCSRSPDARALLPVRRRQRVKEGREGGLLVSRVA
jgi:hypothetical protein